MWQCSKRHQKFDSAIDLNNGLCDLSMWKYWLILSLIALAGCAGSKGRIADSTQIPEESIQQSSEELLASKSTAKAKIDAVSKEVESETQNQPSLMNVGFKEVIPNPALSSKPEKTIETSDLQPPLMPEMARVNGLRLSLDDVINSVYRSYPLLESAVYSRNIASGERITAAGEFDTKFKAATENGPTGFYRNFRQSIGLVKPLVNGGEVFAGYRIGRGEFEPWYLERETNKSGEFKAGVAIPLARDRDIDSRRAELLKRNYGRQVVEPEIQAQLIGFIQEASYAYWEWVAAGEKLRIAEDILRLAEKRTGRIRKQVEAKLTARPELTDNLRLIAERKRKRSDAFRKLQQKSVKLSLYYRDQNGDPFVPERVSLKEFPKLTVIDPKDLAKDMQLAIAQRPETKVINLMRRQVDVDYAQAKNNLLPSVNMIFSGSQDTGTPTSSKNDKGQFELDASLLVDVPIERRKARGKIYSLQGKISQLNAKQRIVEDKIVADVKTAYAGLLSAYEQVREAKQAQVYAADLARREQRNQVEGLSDMLKVTLREQYAVESSEKVIDAILLYFEHFADYRAALAIDQLP